MSRPPTVPPTQEVEKAPQAPKRSSSKTAIAIGLLSVVALSLWTGLRVQEALEKRAATEASARPLSESEGEPAALAQPPSVVRGEKQQHRPSIACEGTLFASQDVDLAFKAGGQLASVRVKLGQLVKRGEVIASLDAVEASAQVKAAEAQLRAAEAQLALAEDAERRTSGMVDAGALPEATGVQVDQQRALALAQVDAARAQLSLARANLSNHTLVAPFTGFVTRVPTGTGSVIAPGMPAFHLSDVTTLSLKGTVGEEDAQLLRVGSEIEIEAQGRTVAGKVVAVLTSVDPMTRRVPFEAEVVNDVEPRLLSGSLVRAKVVAGEAVEVLRLPASALRPGSQSEIMVVDGGKLQARRVTLATSEGGDLLVRSGLSPDEDVLLAPPANAKDGAELASLPGATK